MRVGDRVLVTAHWSSFFGMKGEVTQITPCIMVRLDGDQHPMRLDDCSLRRVDDRPEPHWVAGE